MSRQAVELNSRVVELEAALAAEKSAKAELESDLRSARAAEETATMANRTKDGELEARNREVVTLTGRLSAKDGRISQLERELGTLKQEVLNLDPAAQERQRLEAERLRREAEAEEAEAKAKADASATKKSQILGASLTAAASLIIFGFLWIGDIKPSALTILGVTFLTATMAALAPYLRQLFHLVYPYLVQYWRPISVILSLVLGTTIAALGTPGEGWKRVVILVVTALGYSGSIHAVVEMIHVMYTSKVERNVKIAASFLSAIIGAYLMAAIGTFGMTPANATGLTEPTAGHLILNTLLSLVGIGLLTGISALAGWFGAILLSNLKNLFEKQIEKQGKSDIWLRRAKALTVVASILVGVIVGMAMWPNNGGAASDYLIAISLGFILAVAFFLAEGKVLEACFTRRYSGRIIALLILSGTALASLTGFLTFSKLYALGSSSQRFTTQQDELIRAENAYISATESCAKMFAQNAETPEQAQEFLKGIQEMYKGLELANTSYRHSDLEQSVRVFGPGASKVSMCINAKKQGHLIKAIAVPPQPSPVELGSQVLFGTKAEGVDKVYGGAVFMAACATLVVDYLIVLFALFGLLISRPKEQQIDEDPLTGRIFSILDPSSCIVAINGEGMEVGDTLNILNDDGNAIGALEAVAPVGTGAFECRRVGNNVELARYARVRIVS